MARVFWPITERNETKPISCILHSTFTWKLFWTVYSISWSHLRHSNICFVHTTKASFSMSYLWNTKAPEPCGWCDVCFTEAANPTNVWNEVAVCHMVHWSFHDLAKWVWIVSKVKPVSLITINESLISLPTDLYVVKSQRESLWPVATYPKRVGFSSEQVTQCLIVEWLLEFIRLLEFEATSPLWMRRHGKIELGDPWQFMKF